MSLIDKIEISTRVTRTHNAYSVRVLVMTMPSDRERKRKTEKKAEIRWMVSRGWKRVLEPRPRHMSRIFIRGLPPIPSISTLLAADPCHASRAASPTDIASIVPGQFASRRGDHQRSLSPTNRIRQRAESFASNRSNVPPPVESSISSQVSSSRCKPSIPYHFARRSSTRLSFQITYPRFEYFSFGATIRPFFPFLRARYSKLRG